MGSTRQSSRLGKQNPNKNLPKCGRCSEIIAEKPSNSEEQSIVCDCCANFYHIGCEDVSNEKLEAISEHGLKWYCSYCDKAASSLSEKIIVLETQLINVTSDLDFAKAELHTVKAELKKEKFERMISVDALEQYQRKDSLRITGIPHEAGETTPQLENKVMDIARKLGVELKREEISVTHRLKADKKGGVPTIIKFSTRRSKDLVFGAKKNMKGVSEFDNVFISEDLTRLRFRTLMSAKKCDRYKSASTKGGKIFIWRIGSDQPVKLESPHDLTKLGLEPDYKFLGLEE